MSWTKKNAHPGKIVSASQEVEVMVLEIDTVKRDQSCPSKPKEIRGKILHRLSFAQRSRVKSKT